jgi:hypothetical protein
VRWIGAVVLGILAYWAFSRSSGQLWSWIGWRPSGGFGLFWSWLYIAVPIGTALWFLRRL